VEAKTKASRLHEYSWVRGFNYQPSWGSHGITIWNDFREATFAKEAIRPDASLLVYDISNEPFNGGGKEKGSIELRFLLAMAQQIRELDSKTPISVATQGLFGIGGPMDLDLLDPFWETMYMAFIEPDGTIRPGREVYSEFC
jgi:hypothetical protein